MDEKLVRGHEEAFFTQPIDMKNGYYYSFRAGDCDTEYGVSFNFNDFYKKP